MFTPEQWQLTEKRTYLEFFSSPEKVEKSLEYAVNYCERYDSLLKSIWIESSQNPKGVALCVFGSPSRNEMLGESDLDCMILRDDSVDVAKFRTNFIKKLNDYGFSKLDIPVWGSITDCRNYLKSSITEGNQLVEARFLYGDKTVWENVESLRNQYGSRDRFCTTFAFQYFYFNQYYKQRERKNQKNLKYGHGGTRDFLFPIWLANFREGPDFVRKNKGPSIIFGLQSLLEREDISKKQYEQMKRSVNIIAFLRNELLRQSINSVDSGLTYLGKETAQKIAEHWPFLYNNKKNVLREGLEGIKIIRNLKNICYDAFMKEDEVKKKIGPNVILDPLEELSATILSWNSNLTELNCDILQKLGKSTSWSVLTSLACNPTCSSNFLHYLAERGTQPGYEYVAKVVGRNPMTVANTLNYIINSNIEDRFKEPAQVRLRKGWKKANELQ